MSYSTRAFYALTTLTMLVLAIDASAQSPAGTWELYPPQTSSYTTTVQSPINADGTSNFKSTGKSVIPIKFTLATAPGSVVLQSILLDTDPNNDFSYLSFTPSAPLTFNQITNLTAVYSFTEGNCHLGALRWSVRIDASRSVFIYYGGLPNFTDCTSVGPSVNQSGINMIGQSDVRYDTSQVGGTFYDSYAHAQDLVGSLPIVRASLVLDGGGAAGEQVVLLGNVTVNSNTFIPASGSLPTCTLPPATIQITKTSGSPTGTVNEATTIQPADNNSQFRIAGCAYLYNLDSSSLPGAGTYKVEAVINGSPASGAAFFDLR